MISVSVREHVGDVETWWVDPHPRKGIAVRLGFCRRKDRTYSLVKHANLDLTPHELAIACDLIERELARASVEQRPDPVSQ